MNLSAEFWKSPMGKELLKSLVKLEKEETTSDVLPSEIKWQIDSSAKDLNWLAFSEAAPGVVFPSSKYLDAVMFTNEDGQTFHAKAFTSSDRIVSIGENIYDS